MTKGHTDAVKLRSENPLIENTADIMGGSDCMNVTFIDIYIKRFMLPPAMLQSKELKGPCQDMKGFDMFTHFK